MCTNVHPFCANDTERHDLWTLHSMWERLIIITRTHLKSRESSLDSEGKKAIKTIYTMFIIVPTKTNKGFTLLDPAVLPSV